MTWPLVTASLSLGLPGTWVKPNIPMAERAA
jgi:hypothetical protein